MGSRISQPSIGGCRDEAAQLRRSKRSTSRVAFRITVKIYMHVEYHIPSLKCRKTKWKSFPWFFFYLSLSLLNFFFFVAFFFKEEALHKMCIHKHSQGGFVEGKFVNVGWYTFCGIDLKNLRASFYVFFSFILFLKKIFFREIQGKFKAHVLAGFLILVTEFFFRRPLNRV